MGTPDPTIELSPDRQLGREVAVKLISAARTSPKKRARFEREGVITASLQHPGIVRVHSVEIHKDQPYLVYELVDGCRTLDTILDGLTRSAD